MELMGFDQDVIDDVEKLASISLCSNIPGQVMTGLMVDPPGENDPGYETYIQVMTLSTQYPNLQRIWKSETYFRRRGRFCHLYADAEKRFMKLWTV